MRAPATRATPGLFLPSGPGMWLRLVCLAALAACGGHGGGDNPGEDAGTGDAGPGGDAATDDGGQLDSNPGTDGGATDGGVVTDGGGNPLCGSCGAPPADVCEDPSH